jgi:hypothetical protein
MSDDTTKLIQELRENAKGTYCWRCRHKTDKSYRISFEDYEQHEAKQWFKEHCERYPDTYCDYEMVRVHVLDQREKLMLQAADALEQSSPS